MTKRGGGEARQMRLESDADLVQVVTIHKSKGLEYPLVFLPFACAFRAAKATDLPLKWHDAEGRLQLAPAADDVRCWPWWTGSAWAKTCASCMSRSPAPATPPGSARRPSRSWKNSASAT